MHSGQDETHRITRRTVIAGATIVPVAALTATAQPRKTALSASERQILDAFVDRLAPRDALGPGALEMGAADYIDLSLADYLAPEKAGLVAGLAAVDALARANYGAPFTELPPENKDRVIAALENGTPAAGGVDSKAFFNRIRRLTLEGMFSDPYYGGNKNFAGWDLIRYPGPRLAVPPEDQRMNVLPKPLHQSAYGSTRGSTHGH